MIFKWKYLTGVADFRVQGEQDRYSHDGKEKQDDSYCAYDPSAASILLFVLVSAFNLGRCRHRIAVRVLDISDAEASEKAAFAHSCNGLENNGELPLRFHYILDESYCKPAN